MLLVGVHCSLGRPRGYAPPLPAPVCWLYQVIADCQVSPGRCRGGAAPGETAAWLSPPAADGVALIWIEWPGRQATNGG